MKNINWNPRIVFYAEKVDDAMVYFSPQDKISIEGNVKLQQDVLHLCTGRNRVFEIIEKLKPTHSSQSISELLSLLSDLDIIINAQESWKHYHELSCNPMPLFEPISTEELKALLAGPKSTAHGEVNCFTISSPSSELAPLLMNRGSSRKFTNKGISEKTLKGIVWSTYGTTDTFSVEEAGLRRRTVPSAGALYPLRIYLVICKACDQLSSGVYCLQNCGTSLSRIQHWSNVEQEAQRFHECFIDDAYITNSTASIIISGIVDRETQKYGCRGYRYTILEAGHAAQNIDLFCAGNRNIGCVEVGGFLDNSLSEFFSLPEKIIPITTVFLGSLT